MAAKGTNPMVMTYLASWLDIQVGHPGSNLSSRGRRLTTVTYLTLIEHPESFFEFLTVAQRPFGLSDAKN